MILLWLAAMAAQPAESSQQFIARVFAGYNHANFSPLAHPGRYFAPRLIAAIREDEKLAKGEVGTLDGDPVCQCQDPAGIEATIVRAATEARDKADVEVSILWPSDPPTRAKFSLVHTRAGWRIADVSSADEPSLLAALEKANREAKRRH